jgi:hypothetical protein
MLCSYCYSNDFRKSRFRLGDLIYLLILRIPVRCVDCRKRTHTFPMFKVKRNDSRK